MTEYRSADSTFTLDQSGLFDMPVPEEPVATEEPEPTEVSTILAPTGQHAIVGAWAQEMINLGYSVFVDAVRDRDGSSQFVAGKAW